MICPRCNKDTSDMLTRCEWCGSPLFTGEQQDAGPEAPEPLGDLVNGLAGQAVSEWPSPGVARGPDPGTQQAPGGTGTPWYLTPWPYVIGILVAAAVIASVLIFHKSPKSNPAVVVGNTATLLDFYNDT